MTFEWNKMKLYWSKFKEYRVFSPYKSFFQLGIVWLTFSIILITSIILIFGVTTTEKYTGCMSATCFETFITSYKLPLGVLSLLIPFGAIYAAQHRSEQTIAQIKASKGHNSFVNYYKHLEEFNGMLKDENIDKEFVSIRKLHKMLFPNSKDGSYRIDENLIKNLIVALQKIHQTLMELERFVDSLKNSEFTENEYTDKSFNLILVTYETLLNIRNSFKFNDTEYSLVSLKEKLKKNEVNIVQVIYEIKTTLNCLEKVLSFDEEFDMPDVLTKLTKLDWDPKDNKALSIDNPIKIKLSNI
ncbi:hypothetical protein [Thalassotalea castellviae]|uniref:Uncharacterized protein n=1 Tax=Thalassotalea castellviae TaxID=3075612 RepID=A0ABU3A4S9_9GAMM|nr:hypothetical protein [Thalassotalea sp. W431]MDT0604532.1 hypothetical protein [Thalassotalea sp. W431]